MTTTSPAEVGGPGDAGRPTRPADGDAPALAAAVGEGLDRLERGLAVPPDELSAPRLVELTSLALGLDEQLDQLDVAIDLWATGRDTPSGAPTVEQLDALADGYHQRFRTCRDRLTHVEPAPELVHSQKATTPKPPWFGRLGTALIAVGVVLIAFVLFNLVVAPLVVDRSQRVLAGQFRDQLTIADAVASGGSAGNSSIGLSALDADQLKVPKLAGETVTGAIDRLKQDKLKVQVTTEAFTGCIPDTNPCSEAVPGLVLRTSPAAEQPVKEDDTVTVVVADQARGAPVAALRIPAIGLNWMVVEGTGTNEMSTGPGHYRLSPLPGEPGNAVIAGHRTLFGAPFRRLDQLAVRDEIVATTLAGDFTYRVTETRVLGSGEPDVIGPSRKNTLTLVSSNPPYSSQERLAVIAELEGKPVKAFSIVVEGKAIDRTIVISPEEKLDAPRDVSPWVGVLVFTELFALVVGVTFVLYRRWLRWPTWLITTPLILAAALLCFTSITKLFPTTM